MNSNQLRQIQHQCTLGGNRAPEHIFQRLVILLVVAGLALFLVTACQLPPPKPYEPQTPAEKGIAAVIKTFLDAKKAGKLDDQQTCTESAAREPLEVKEYLLVDIKTPENIAIVRITDPKGNTQDYEFMTMIADPQNKVFCILRFLPKR